MVDFSKLWNNGFEIIIGFEENFNLITTVNETILTEKI